MWPCRRSGGAAGCCGLQPSLGKLVQIPEEEKEKEENAGVVGGDWECIAQGTQALSFRGPGH